MIPKKFSLQLKSNAGAPVRKPPVAPPVYRPQPVPVVLQRKLATNQTLLQPKSAPVPPPVYRPQPTPRVLQQKQGIKSAVPPPRRIPGPPVAQLKPAGVVRPGAKTVQLTPQQNLRRPNGVVQCVGLDELKVALLADKRFAAEYKPWITHKLKVSGLTEDKIIEKFSMAQLKDSANQFAIHSRNLDKIADSLWKDVPGLVSIFTNKLSHAKEFISAYYAENVAKALLKSATLIKAAGPKLPKHAKELETQIKAAIQVADLETFDRLRLQIAEGRALSKQDELVHMDFAQGFRNGEKFFLRLGSGTPGDDFHVPIHEFMHTLSSSLMKVALGSTLNEGLTEIITLDVMRDAGLQCVGSYANERAEVEKLISYLEEDLHIARADLYYAYFNLGIMGGCVEGLMPAIEMWNDL